MNHYSWGMCTTFAECKTVMTVMLMVKSEMNPHIISWDYGLVWEWFGLVWVGATTASSSWSWSFFVMLSSWKWIFFLGYPDGVGGS
jgi:hypothetical protein